MASKNLKKGEPTSMKNVKEGASGGGLASLSLFTSRIFELRGAVEVRGVMLCDSASLHAVVQAVTYEGQLTVVCGLVVMCGLAVMCGQTVMCGLAIVCGLGVMCGLTVMCGLAVVCGLEVMCRLAVICGLGVMCELEVMRGLAVMCGLPIMCGLAVILVDYHQLGRLVSESACEREDPGSNPAADMVDAARNTAWDLGKQPNNYRSNYPTQEWARSVSQSGPYRLPWGVEEMQGGGRRVCLEWGAYITI
ncbi:hypothetical protein FHG87_002340 [Trinorchestia longiramus]|nr:hypothetical protein FHG87_002340 [Trinorchestia longiramus]